MSSAPNYDHEEQERNHAALGVNPSLQPSAAVTTTSTTSTMTCLQPEFRLVSVRCTVFCCVLGVKKSQDYRHGRVGFGTRFFERES
jgi:hypothetical protein